MPGDGPRLRTALDARALVPPERDALTGRLAAQARQRKQDRSQPRSRRLGHRVLRTPAGIAGALVIAVAAITGVALASTGGTDDERRDEPEQTTRVGESPGAAPGAGSPADVALPKACDTVDQARASQIMGEHMQTLAKQSGISCTYWSDDDRDTLTFALLRGDQLPFLRRLYGGDQGLDVRDLPVLGQGAFGFPARTTEKGGGAREWIAAAAIAPYEGNTLSLTIGHSDGTSHAIRNEQDLLLATTVAEQILSELRTGTAVAGVS